jgi:ribosomal protein S18 acetylase RimI-like enzyme
MESLADRGRRVTVTYTWRGRLENHEVNVLHAEAFGHRVLDDDWQAQLDRHSLGWVSARDSGSLVGFVNVAWDGGVHAFILDTIVAAAHRRRGIGRELVRIAEAEVRVAGCEWLHVDFDDELIPFYVEACGFTSAPAGVKALSRR